jgi:hypothetical protein
MPLVFRGYPEYLTAAAKSLGLCDPRSREEATRSSSLPRLSDLVAELKSAPHTGRPEILRDATRSRDALAIAYEAAEELLADAHRAYGFNPPPRILRPPPPQPPRRR